MIELGTLLREARERQGLDLAAAERATRIRRRHLSAMESDRFDLLPGDAYARAFLREYARFLGVDEKLVLEEYDLRYRQEEPLPLPPLPPARRSWLRAGLVLGALVTAGVVVAALAWRPGGGERPHAASRAPAPRPQVARARPTPPPPRPRPSPPPRLELVAVGGDSWILVRRGSRQGAELFQGILARGQRRRFLGRLWIRMGAPWNVEARLDGKPVPLPIAQVGNVLVTRAGIRPAP
ncbi:MAG: hypothetical protein C4306_01730 [Thermoleophilia bacterium]